MFVFNHIVRGDIESKEFNLYVLRSHYQVRARIKLLGRKFYMQRSNEENELFERKTTILKGNYAATRRRLRLYEEKGCPDPEETEIHNIERYKITLNMRYPTLKDLYGKIKEVCPEFHHKRLYHLYWKSSPTEILPIVNYVTYVSMIAMIGRHNDNLFLVAREWNDSWNTDIAEHYIPLPEDQILIDMIAPKIYIFTALQELQMGVIHSASRAVYTQTYNPPVREEKSKGRKSSPTAKAGSKDKGKSKSPKLKSEKKK